MKTVVSCMAVSAVPPPEVPSQEPQSHGIMDVSTTLMIWTWVTFAAMAVILYKIAWKPILTTLNLREDKIRRALEDAEKARLAAVEADQKRSELLTTTRTEVDEIMKTAREAASRMSQSIESHAREEAQVMLVKAKQEIERATDQARQTLRAETAALAALATLRFNTL